MRLLVTAFALLFFAGSVAAGPLDSLQYRASFRFDSLPGPGPVRFRDTAYPFGSSPLFGIITQDTPEWQDTFPAYPSADFAFQYVGSLRTYIANDAPPYVNGSEPYRFDVELRDTDGRVGAVSFGGSFGVTWSDGYGYASPFGGPQSGSLLLGDTRYDVQLSYERALFFYQDFGSGVYFRSQLVLIPTTPYPDGEYTSAFGGIFYATITPTPEPIGTPEPGTLALAVAGFAGMFAVRRLRRTAA